MLTDATRVMRAVGHSFRIFSRAVPPRRALAAGRRRAGRAAFPRRPAPSPPPPASAAGDGRAVRAGLRHRAGGQAPRAHHERTGSDAPPPRPHTRASAPAPTPPPHHTHAPPPLRGLPHQAVGRQGSGESPASSYSAIERNEIRILREFKSSQSHTTRLWIFNVVAQ